MPAYQVTAMDGVVPPHRSQERTVFAANGDDMLGRFPAYTSQLNALATDVYSNAVSAGSYAAAAGVQAANALASANAAAASAAGMGGRGNAVVNGGCLVAQNTNVNCSGLTGLYYGGVDGFVYSASPATAGTAGAVSSGVSGDSRVYSGFSGLTMASGSLVIGERLESSRAKRFNGQSITLSCVVTQNTGANLTLNLSINKPTALNNFSSVTAINSSVTANGSAVVPSGVPTKVSYTLPANAANDFTNGLYWNLWISGFSCTAKTIGISEIVLDTAAVPFVYEDYSVYLSKCERTFRKYTGRCTNSADITHDFEEMAKTPTLSNVYLPFGSGATFTAIDNRAFYQATANSTASVFSLFLDARL